MPATILLCNAILIQEYKYKTSVYAQCEHFKWSSFNVQPPFSCTKLNFHEIVPTDVKLRPCLNSSRTVTWALYSELKQNTGGTSFRVGRKVFLFALAVSPRSCYWTLGYFFRSTIFLAKNGVSQQFVSAEIS